LFFFVANVDELSYDQFFRLTALKVCASAW